MCLAAKVILLISGILAAPYNFSVAMSNTTFVFSWGAPYSLDVTDCSPDIFYYTLCTNITIYGCRNISSDPHCTFPRTCTTSLDYNGPLINGFQNITTFEYGGSILEFTFYAVNGAGNGNVTTTAYVGTQRTETGLLILHAMRAILFFVYLSILLHPSHTFKNLVSTNCCLCKKTETELSLFGFIYTAFQTTVITTTAKLTVSIDGPTTTPIGHFNNTSPNAIGKK